MPLLKRPLAPPKGRRGAQQRNTAQLYRRAATWSNEATHHHETRPQVLRQRAGCGKVSAMSSKTSAAAIEVRSPQDLRNVVLVGSSGSGKTTLFENLLKARVLGYRGEKDEPERAAALTFATIPGNDCVINLLDAPGHPDFVGELRAGLRAADAAIFVISAADGIDPTTQVLWNECKRVGLPRAVVVTKLDQEHSDFEGTVDVVRTAFGDGVHPAYIPLKDAAGDITGNLSLLTKRTHDYSSGQRVARASSDDEVELIEQFRADYVESIIAESEDDALLERYFDGAELTPDEIVDDIMKAMYHGAFFPVIPVLTSGVGTEELIGVISRGFPTPLRRQLPDVVDMSGDPVDIGEVSESGPLLGEVIRTTSDPFAGRLSMVRLFSGTLKSDDVLHIAGQRELFSMPVNQAKPDHVDTEKAGGLSSPSGTDLVAKAKAVAGEIIYIAKLGKAETADTISAPDKPLVVEPWTAPTPLLPMAVHAVSRNDEDKLAGALNRLVVEDSAVQVQRAEGTDQLLIWTMGQAHNDLLMARLKDRYGVNVEAAPIKVALRETFIAPSEAQGRHVKQSGGHGQYGVCHIRVEPLERGAGFEFVDQVVGGAVPRQFIPSVEKGVRAQLERGTVSGYPMVDVRVILDDGKSHSVDSSDMAFQSAGALALKEAATPAKVALLEPLDEVAVTVSDAYLGSVMTDMSNRRGTVSGTTSSGDGTSTVKALVPQSELSRYAIDLRGLAQGTGTFTRTFHGYEIMPAAAAQEVIKAHQAKQS